MGRSPSVLQGVHGAQPSLLQGVQGAQPPGIAGGSGGAAPRNCRGSGGRSPAVLQEGLGAARPPNPDKNSFRFHVYFGIFLRFICYLVEKLQFCMDFGGLG